MTPTRIFAALLWAAMLVIAVRQGLSLAGMPLPGGFAPDLKGWVTLALPAFFAGTLPLWMRGHPLDMKQIRDSVDGHFTPGTYNRFMATVRPLQLLAMVGTVTGLTCLLVSRSADTPPAVYATGFFFLSAGVGFIACLLLLRARGHRLE
ncbi:MAG: hypothetical protein IPF94_07000 [Betaproteobacteria bacterium]|nr:hypothetical protein [Betaproteobacteria bacterium]